MQKTTVNLEKMTPYILIAIVCLSVFLVPFGNADELWNYNFGKQIAEGSVPYRDFNMIQTPLAAYLCAGCLLLGGKGLLAYRVAGYLLMVGIFSLVFSLCKKITRSAPLAGVCTAFCFALNIAIYIYNYNYLSVFVLLLIISLELREEMQPRWGIFITALLVGLLPLIKQNTGAAVLAAYGMLTIVEAFIDKRADYMVLKAGGVLLPGSLYVLYLIISGNWVWFVDYAVCGIGEFIHRKSIFAYMCESPTNFLLCVALLVPIILAVCSGLLKNRFLRQNRTVFWLSAAWFISAAVPLFDGVHFYVGIIPLIPATLTLVEIPDIPAWQGRICSICSGVVAAVAVTSIVALASTKTYSKLQNYEGIPIEVALEYNIETVGEYIRQKEKEGVEVYIANEYSAAYTIPLNLYRKNWDMLLVGNLGTTSVLEMLKVDSPAEFLVLKDQYPLNMQAHFELIDYIKSNYKLTGEVLNFDVYRKE